jgi:NAD(P)-dependent dehydrogenase (short-subunit alcohol dehydrogenase family)
MQLDGKTILITGSTDGVGRRVALELAAAGARVLVHGRDLKRGEQVVTAIASTGRPAAMFYRADLSSLDEVRGLAAAVRRDQSRLDVLIIRPQAAGAGAPAGLRRGGAGAAARAEL